jgi:hypothetical protein
MCSVHSPNTTRVFTKNPSFLRVRQDMSRPDLGVKAPEMVWSCIDFVCCSNVQMYNVPSDNCILPLFVEPVSILCFVHLLTLVLALSAFPHGFREYSFIDVLCLCKIASQPQSQSLLRRILSFLVLTTRLKGYDNV